MKINNVNKQTKPPRIGSIFIDKRNGGTRTITGEQDSYWIIEMQSGNIYPMRKISVDIAVEHGLWERDSG